MANRRTVVVLKKGHTIHGIYTNLLAAHTKLRNTVKPSLNDGVPSYITVYRGFLNKETFVDFHTELGTFTIEKHKLYLKAA